MHGVIGLLGRIVTVVLALEVADVPFICSDGWPVSPSGSAAETMASSPQRTVLATADGVVRAGTVSVDDCACPCHFSFRSASTTTLVITADFAPVNFGPPGSSLSLPPASLDHPPQNLL